MLIKKINTSLNSFQLYTLFKDKPYSFFLDSGMDHEKLGNYSIIGFDPFLIFKNKGDKTDIYENGSISTYYGNPFDKLKKVMSAYKMDYKTKLPFVGGAVGYLGYDLYQHLEDLPRTTIDDVNIPDCYFGLYDGVIVIDHTKDEIYIASLGIKDDEEKIVANIEDVIMLGEENGVEISISSNSKSSEIVSNFTKEDYLDRKSVV